MEEGGSKPPPGWPGDGRIEYQGVSAIYRPGLLPVLRDLTFAIPVRARGASMKGVACHMSSRPSK